MHLCMRTSLLCPSGKGRGSGDSSFCCCYCCLVPESCLNLWDPMDCSPLGSSVHEISQAKYWSGLPFTSPGALPDPGTKLASPVLQVDPLPLSYLGSPRLFIYLVVIDGTEGSLVRGAVTLVTAGVGREGRGAVMEPSPSPLRDAHPHPLLTVAVTENLLLRQAIRSPVTSVEKLSLSLSKFC